MGYSTTPENVIRRALLCALDERRSVLAAYRADDGSDIAGYAKYLESVRASISDFEKMYRRRFGELPADPMEGANSIPLSEIQSN